MATLTADNFLQLPHNGVYGNKSQIVGSYANLGSPAIAAGDLLDLVKIPGGAQVTDVSLISTQFTGTSTYAVGIRYADGTSTGGTTGTNVMIKTTATALATLTDHGLTATYAQTVLKFKPFTNDVDTILYLTKVSGPAESTNDDITAIVGYVATGTK